MFKLNIPFFSLIFLCLFNVNLQAETNVDELTQGYIKKWVDFYPSEAFSYGNKSAAFHFEDFSAERVSDWLEYNRQTAKKLLPLSGKLDARVLLRKTKQELEHWHYDKVLLNQPIWYAELISQAMTYVLVREEFSNTERLEAAGVRLQGVHKLAVLGIEKLTNGSRQRSTRSLNILKRTASFYRDKLPAVSREWGSKEEHMELVRLAEKAAASLEKLASHIEISVLPKSSIPDHFDNADYARKLKIDVDSDITPEQLRDSALQEINEVRNIMSAEARLWWQKEKSETKMPAAETDLLQAAMQAMENERADNRKDFLGFFTEHTLAAEKFLIEHELATVPLPRTLFVGLSPDHFSGAAYGGVYPTGPFNPGANTLFYLPSIPDDSSEEQKKGFYQSFNRHFNTMIIAHEMYPGHYLQYKVAVSEAPAARSLFANGVYVEGWGTFSEVIMLDAGWGKSTKLTRLAHLRKRLENATRAYVSVMVHHEGWNKTQLVEFATSRGLLAPQFAENLWNRVMNSPLQITNYFIGFHKFSALWEREQKRLASNFRTRDFVDAVLRAGPIPIDALDATFN